MVESSDLHCIRLKHFPLDEANAFVQVSVDMTEAQYLQLAGNEKQPVTSNRGKMLV